MSFIMRSHKDRYRKKARENFYRSFVIFSCFIFAVLIGYFGGQRKYLQETRQLTQHVEELSAQTSKTEQMAMNQEAAFQTLSVKYNQLREKYARDIPQGDLGLLVSLLKEQLDKGLATERIAQIIRAAQPPQNCTQPLNKRVIVSTPAYSGPESVVTFADGLITAKSMGDASANKSQEKEAWFDPGKPVSVIFTIIGGKNETKQGLLPLHHTIIFKGKEYRFTISEGPRSFVIITSDSCDYPEELTAPADAEDHSASSTDKVM